MRNLFAAVTRNSISLLGSAITTIAAVLILTLFGLSLVGLQGSPYLGILVYLVLPAIFVIGLLLIPIGIYRQHKAERNTTTPAKPVLPVMDLNQPKTRQSFLIFLVLSVINVVIISIATYEGVKVMDSTAFCGTTCHTVMKPEYTSYRHSPHARVECVSCHIGPGASWFVRSKLSGTWQVIAVLFNLYPRPIPTPVANLRPARETCEQCHWPEKFEGNRLQVITRYSPDEANTPLKTVLFMHIGGGPRDHGIHWHVSPGVRIRYRSNHARTEISEVEATRPGAATQLFTSGPTNPPDSNWRLMDCIDCHNRPTHILYPPGQAIDEYMELGRIPADLPFVKREGLRILQLPYATSAEAQAQILDNFLSFYRQSHPGLMASRYVDIARAGTLLADVYSRNVFPAMHVGWNTYPNFIGHPDFSGGCFRCHDGSHTNKAGNAIPGDCSLCHDVLADQEKAPAILKQLGE